MHIVHMVDGVFPMQYANPTALCTISIIAREIHHPLLNRVQKNYVEWIFNADHWL